MAENSIVWNNEGEVLFVAAHGQHHADVAEADEQRHANDLAMGGRIVRIAEEPGMVNDESNDGPQEQPERGSGKSAERKALQHFVDGNHEPAEPKAHDHPLDGMIEPFGAHLANRKTTTGAKAQKQNTNDPKCHDSVKRIPRSCQGRRRFVLRRQQGGYSSIGSSGAP